VPGGDAPDRLELIEEVHDEEDKVVHGERGEVGPGGGTHATLDPDEKGEQVAGEADDVPDGRDVLVDDLGRRTVRVEELGGIPAVHDRRKRRRPTHRVVTGSYVEIAQHGRHWLVCQ